MSGNGYLNEQDAMLALRRMTMAEIRTLTAIKSNGTISLAATAIGLSQSAVSQHVRELEEKLNIKLFDRHRRGIEPTRFGFVLMKLAATIGKDLQTAAGELVHASRSPDPPLRVGSMPVASGGIISLAMSLYEKIAGTPDVVLLEGSRAELLEHLRHGRIDFYVGRLSGEGATPDLREELLFHDRVAVIVSENHPALRAGKPVDLEELLGYHWILPEEEATLHSQLMETFHESGFTAPAPRIRSYSIIGTAAMVAASTLIGFMPESLFKAGTLARGLRTLDVNVRWKQLALGIITGKHAASSFGGDTLKALLQQQAATMLRGVADHGDAANKRPFGAQFPAGRAR